MPGVLGHQRIVSVIDLGRSSSDRHEFHPNVSGLMG